MISSKFLFWRSILDNVNLLLVFTGVYLDFLLLNKYTILENSLSGAADPAETEKIKQAKLTRSASNTATCSGSFQKLRGFLSYFSSKSCGKKIKYSQLFLQNTFNYGLRWMGVLYRLRGRPYITSYSSRFKVLGESFFFLVNRVEHQKLNQTTAELSFGWVFGVQLGLRQTQ